MLLPRGDRADDRLPALLRSAGAKVVEVAAYRTVMPESFDPVIVESVRKGEVDVILFASPSTFENFRKAIAPTDAKELSNRVQFAAIGPTTAAAIREAGARVTIESDQPSATGLANAIAKYYQDSPHSTRRA